MPRIQAGLLLICSRNEDSNNTRKKGRLRRLTVRAGSIPLPENEKECPTYYGDNNTPTGSATNEIPTSMERNVR